MEGDVEGVQDLGRGSETVKTGAEGKGGEGWGRGNGGGEERGAERRGQGLVVASECEEKMGCCRIKLSVHISSTCGGKGGRDREGGRGERGV